VVWATEVVEAWPDDVREAPYDVAAAEEALVLAEQVTELLDRTAAGR